MDSESNKYIFSFGAPFALISLESIHDWFGATGHEGKQYDILLDILESLEIDCHQYRIVNCIIDDIHLTLLDNSSNIYKLSDTNFFQLEYIDKVVKFSEIKRKSVISIEKLEVNIKKGNYVLFDSACEFSDLKVDQNYFMIEISLDIDHIIIEYHSDDNYSGWDLQFVNKSDST